MKKTAWIFGMLLGMFPTVFATPSDLAVRVSRAVVEQQTPQQMDDRLVRMQNQLENVRQLVGNMQQEDVSVVMQAVLELADAFFEYAAQNPELKTQEFQFRKGVNIKGIVREIERPMEVGWCHTEVFAVSYAIDSFLEGDLSACWSSEDEKKELQLFSQVLKTYSQENVDDNIFIKLLLGNLPRGPFKTRWFQNAAF